MTPLKTALLILLGIIPWAMAADLPLLDSKYDLKTATVYDAVVTSLPGSPSPGLRMATGHAMSWPGVTLVAPAGVWSLTAYAEVAADVKNLGKSRVTVSCRVDNPGADGTKNCLTGSISLDPGKSGTLHVPLLRHGDDTMGGKLFGMRGYPVGPGSKRQGIDPGRVNQVLFFVGKPKEDHAFEITGLRAAGEYVAPTASTTDANPYFPFIDTFGQYKHRDWPGKIHSLAEMTAARESEARDLAAQPGPQGWSRYGGYANGPRLNATGFFRTEKVDGVWWLVDPEGCLFFSHGIDCVRMVDTTPIEERESWFEDFPGAQEEFKEFLTKGNCLKGYYAGRSPQCFAFAAANMKRKYGANWRKDYAETAHRRLRSWGLNTIANWSDSSVFLMRKTPYTDTLGSRGARMIEGSEGYWGKFPDVYDASFAESVRRGMEAKKGASANDPWCIGYFSDNEMSWGDDTSLAIAALKSPPSQAVKVALLADLKARYADIAKLNSAWGTAHTSWDALLQSREAPDKAKARSDLTAFYTRTAETYFRTVRDAIKSVAPRQLYLGCRFAWVNDLAAKAAAGYCDVVSYNLYHRSVADFRYPGGDKPLIIGEFHFGALDRGMFHTGLVPTASQRARAQAYRDYVMGALRHPQFVGTHWFQWKDEPTTGRVYDEENYQIGFLNVADTPYRETVEAAREVGAAMYQNRLATAAKGNVPGR